MSALYSSLSVPLSESLSRATNGDRIVLCGPYPPAAEYRAWLSDCPGWSARISKARSSGVCEATYTRSEIRVRVTSAASWFGDEPSSPEQCRRRLSTLAERLNAAFRRGGRLPLVSPAVTGLTLWRETAEDEYPPLPEGIQTLIRATCGQGREEVLWAGGPEIPGFVYLDMRLAYGAFCENLPCGPVCRDEGLELPWHGRVRARVTIPREWRGVGLLPLKAGRFSPHFPRTAGQEFETWLDAREARLAQTQGWRVEVLERLVMREGRPLNTWSRRLIRVMADYEERGDKAGARAVRAVLLQAIGDLHGRGRVAERVFRTREGAELVREAPLARRAERLSHPEWSAAIWARCRYRLARALLDTPPELLLGCCVDALYLTEDPCWPGTGKPGEWRLKGVIPAPRPAPRTLTDLHRLSDEARDGSG